MIVVATEPDALAAVQQALAAAGARVTDVSAPSPDRRLVLARPADAWAAERAVAELRRRGLLAVERPDDGPRLTGWREHTRPATFGDRVSVCVAWSEHDRAGLPGLVELGLGGFGNGHHPTTRLLIEELIGRISGGERVLDVGCGSGVLGLAALRLGAHDLVAVDIDLASVDATRANAQRNRLAERVQATTAPLSSLAEPFDVVLANIARGATVELAPDLVRLVRPCGWLAVSGITPTQCDQVTAFLRPLVEAGRRTIGDWACLVLAPTDDSPA